SLLAGRQVHELTQPLPEQTVAHLVVVLDTHHELTSLDVPWEVAVTTAAEGRVVASVDERALERRGEVRKAAEVPVVATALARQQRVDGVVEVIAPLRV